MADSDSIFSNLARPKRRTGEDFYDDADRAFREVLFFEPEGPLRVRPSKMKGGASGAAPSPPTWPENTVAPVVSGTATVGSVLSCTTGTWTNSPTGYTYQWQRNGTNIAGATSSTYTTVTADNGTSVSCNVTASNASGSTTATSNALSITVAVAWTPASLPGLVAWFDGQKASSIILNGSTVSQWNDQSGNGHNAVQGTAANQPTYGATALNGYPALTFNGSTNSLVAAVAAGAFSSAFAWYGVINDASAVMGPVDRSISTFPSPYGWYGGWEWSGNGTNSNNMNSYFANYAVNLALAGTVNIAGGTFTNFLNGTQVYQGTPTYYADTATSVRLGIGANGAFYTGVTGEMVLTNVLATSDRQKLEGYMAWRWGLQANLPSGHPYAGAPP